MNAPKTTSSQKELTAERLKVALEEALAVIAEVESYVPWPSHDPRRIRMRACLNGYSDTCPTCGEREPYTGTCGAAENDTRAFCRRNV